MLTQKKTEVQNLFTKREKNSQNKRFNSFLKSFSNDSENEEEVNSSLIDDLIANTKDLDSSTENINQTKPKRSYSRKNKKLEEKDIKKPQTLTLDQVNNDYSGGAKSFESFEKKIKKDLKKDKKDKVKSDKEKSAKKTRLKAKLLSTIKIINKINNMRIPMSFIFSIRKAKLELIQLDLDQQQIILDTVEKLSKEELTIMLLLIPTNTDELKFLKEVFITKQYLDNLFRNIDYKLC